MRSRAVYSFLGIVLFLVAVSGEALAAAVTEKAIRKDLYAMCHAEAELKSGGDKEAKRKATDACIQLRLDKCAETSDYKGEGYDRNPRMGYCLAPGLYRDAAAKMTRAAKAASSNPDRGTPRLSTEAPKRVKATGENDGLPSDLKSASAMVGDMAVEKIDELTDTITSTPVKVKKWWKGDRNIFSLMAILLPFFLVLFFIKNKFSSIVDCYNAAKEFIRIIIWGIIVFVRGLCGGVLNLLSSIFKLIS